MALPHALAKSVPIIKQLWLPLLNLVGEKHEFRVIVTSPEYVEFQILWGVISFEKGEKKEFVIRGTDAYIASIVSSLNSRRLKAQNFIK